MSLLPPIYSQQDPDIVQVERSDVAVHPQIVIAPAVNAVNFQKGYLGADGERAAIEGELQIKGIDPAMWLKVTVSLRTTETAYQHVIELGSCEIELFSQTLATRVAFPSSFPFAIPLMPDSPQAIQTPHSSLSHVLTATLHPVDHLMIPLSKSVTVHTRRYTSHSYSPVISPETHNLDEPTRVQVEIPRSTFKSGEAIPIYVSVPPPTRELVVDKGLRLRNVRTELVRIVKVHRQNGETDDGSDCDDEIPSGYGGTFEERIFLHGSSLTQAESASHVRSHPSSSKSPAIPSSSSSSSSYRAVIARSGASCRFHSSRAIRLRFVLHQSRAGSPSNFQVSLPNGEHEQLDNDAECGSITQITLLHSVTFYLYVHISFVDMTSRTERISTVSIPVTILAPPAPLPEVSESIDAAYQKKHDRPPARTVRLDDHEHLVPHYSGEAGPSLLPNNAPPPFEERDAPPPFFSSAAEASTSARLPTFLESETEMIIPNSHADSTGELPTHSLSIAGEGIEFGFLPSQQFDGHCEDEDMGRSSTPPPTLEMATRDTNLTPLADIREPERAIEALGLVLDQHEATNEQPPPPPPPAMDDPSDPPPSIDSDFRSPDASRQTSSAHPSPPLHPSYVPIESQMLHSPIPALSPQLVQIHAPPPYLIPDAHGDHEHVARPPPYMD